MEMLKNFVVFVLIGAIAALAFAYSGLYNVAASEPHSGLVAWFLSTVSQKSVESQAADIEVPDLSSLEIRLAGISDYDEMCAECHTPPGRRDSPMAQGLNPAPPDLAELADTSSAELFWVTKYGIKMTGMPAWGATHDDADIWPVVAFLKDLPDLDGEGYQSMLHEADGMGHH